MAVTEEELRELGALIDQAPGSPLSLSLMHLIDAYHEARGLRREDFLAPPQPKKEPNYG